MIRIWIRNTAENSALLLERNSALLLERNSALLLELEVQFGRHLGLIE
jgi:hypothetical protein